MFRNLLYRFQMFMYGRYGSDALNMFLLILGILLSYIPTMFGFPVFSLLAYIPEGYFLFRMFSKNIPARQRELQAFNKVWIPVRNFFTKRFGGWFRYQAERFQYRSLYKYFNCPKCGQHLRAPRNRGTILVTCQRCHTEFRKKV